MRELKNKIKQRWSSWSSLRKGQVLGVLTGVLVTFALCIPEVLAHPKNPLDASALLAELTVIPGTLLATVFGKSGQSFLSVLYSIPVAFTIYIHIINALLGLLAGSLIGGFIGIVRRKKKIDVLLIVIALLMPGAWKILNF